MLQIGRSNAIVHPRAMMIHATDAAIADAAVMCAVWLVAAAKAAHGVKWHTLGNQWYGRGGNRSRVRQHGLDVTGQCQCATRYVNDGDGYRTVALLGQQENGKATVNDQDPNDHGHDRSDLIAMIQPNAIVFGCAKGTRKRLIINESVFVIGIVVEGRKDAETCGPRGV